jgi:CheY-like chemotaxis protein
MIADDTYKPLPFDGCKSGFKPVKGDSLSPLRILVVEDHELFRRFVCRTLKKSSEFRVVCEVSDGLEAVRIAEELQPDLVVLDIGLPGINGLEAARRIRRSCPDSKILFLSMETDVNVVQEALRVGALGYVEKTRVVMDLPAAVEAVCQGRQFVSNGLSADSFAATASNCACGHEVQFYSDDAIFLDSLIPFITNSLRAGNKTVVIATEPHRKALLQHLHANELDCVAAIGQGLYSSLDAADALSAFMEDSGPNRGKFLSTFGPLVRGAEAIAEAKPKSVVVFGEMVAVLCAEGKTVAAIQLEQLWNELLRSHRFLLRCAYPTTDGRKEELYAEICAEHNAVLPVSS